MDAISTPIVEINIIIVAKALIFGLIPPVRKVEKITIGSVVDSGDETKLAMTTSSKDRANDKNQPARQDGIIRGSVISVNTVKGFAPKSIAASSKLWSTSCNLDLTITTTYAIPSVI